MATLFPGSTVLLPQLDSLFIQGSYPPSSVIHYCISFLESLGSQNQSRIAILSPSKPLFVQSLVNFNDTWLNQNAGLGRYGPFLDRIDNFYPTTPSHWSLLCSGFMKAFHPDTSVPSTSKVIIDCGLSLLVLHEPSFYFLGINRRSEHTISSYLNLITQAFATATFFSVDAPRVCVALFDSNLPELKLPILRPVLADSPSETQPEPDQDNIEDEPVTPAVSRYFHWCGTVEVGSEINAVDTKKVRIKRLRLDPSEPFQSQEHIVLEWREETIPPWPGNTRNQTIISFQDGSPEKV